MKTIYLFMLTAVFAVTQAAAQGANNCLECHKTFEDDNGPSHKIARDIHFAQGLGCADCHGGDPALTDMDEVRAVKGYRGIPDHLQVPEFCARCHSDADYMRQHNPALPVDQLDKYKTSVHGKRLFEQKDSKVANCISCHSVHEIANAKMPYSSTYHLNLPNTCASCHADAAYMAGYNIPTDQFDKYKASVHGVALLERGDQGAPACNDCHGNHGAAPPGVSSLSAVCGLCHAIEAELYNDSPHRAAFEDMGQPMCETCHSNHKIVHPTDDMIGWKEPGICGDCHSPEEANRAPHTIDSMRAGLTTLIATRTEANQYLHEATQKGMLTTDAEFLMKEVDQAVIQTRIFVHSFTLDSLAAKAQGGIEKAQRVQARSVELIDQYYFRRKGLAVATLIMTFLAIVLYVKIRRLGK